MSYSPGKDWWDAEGRRERLIELWADPTNTCAAIGRALGATKNSVIGIVHRMGLPPRRIIERQPVIARSALEDLGPNDCRWPRGHPGEPEFSFCGRAALENKPYCAQHYKIAHNVKAETDQVAAP